MKQNDSQVSVVVVMSDQEEHAGERSGSASPDRLYRRLLQDEIERKINDAIRNSFRSVAPSVVSARDADNGPSGSTILKGDILPQFDPDQKTSTVTSWLQKIEQLGQLHRWTEYEKACYMQNKLKGSARDWYNRLDDYDKTWDQWKTALTQAFPRHTDYATSLEELVARFKRPEETMTHYYHAKIALAQQCRMDNDATISCVIKGLPLELQANARAFKCASPDELYAGFIAPMDNYRSPASSTSSYAKRPRFEAPTPNPHKHRNNPSAFSGVRCYTCGKSGHVSRDCQRRNVRCFTCNRKGHVSADCYSRKSSEEKRDTPRNVKTVVDNIQINNIYKKKCKINTVEVIGFVDTGSEVNVVTADIAKKLGLKTNKKNVVLKGFGGRQVHCNNECLFMLEVDGIRLQTSAVVSDTCLDGIDLLIGQPVLSSGDLSVVIKGGVARIVDNLSDFLRNITIAEKERPKTILQEDVTLPAGSTKVVSVAISGVSEKTNVFTEARCFPIGQSVICMPAGIQQAQKSRAIISNIGTGCVSLQKGQLLARGEECTEIDADGVENLSAAVSTCRIACDKIDMSCVDVNESLDSEALNQLKEMIKKWQHCFASNTKELGVVKDVEMSITLKDPQPVCIRPYRLSFKEREIVQNKVNDLLEAGIVQESQSDFASPVILVKKNNGDHRLCVDYRALNKKTVKDVYPMPNIEEQLNCLANKKYFTSLDCSQGFHQIPVAADSINKTAFITTEGHYEYLRTPFGLMNAPAVFQRFINKVIGTLRYENILVYMDDILVPSTTVEEGLQLLEKLFTVIDKFGLKLNLQKCSFLKSQVDYLGHTISAAGTSPGSRKIEAVEKFPVPKNIHEIRQFIGLCGYFRKFIENFAIIASPITNLTKKNVKWEWGETQQNAFDLLKTKLINKPVLASFNVNLETEVHTDASSKGLGGILIQKQENGDKKPVAYFSRVTSAAERVYHSYELETLAVIESLKRFRVYLLGLRFKIVTDCSAVRYAFNKRDLIPRIARWWLAIQEFDFDICHQSGKTMGHVDALSRNVPESNIAQLSSLDDWFLTVQLQDEKLKIIIDQLNSDDKSSVEKEYKIKNDRLYRKTPLGDRLVVPKSTRWQMLMKYHDQIGHPGIKKCETLLKENYWFAGMTRFIKKYVSACIDCAYKKGNHGKGEGELYPIEKSSIPMDTVHIDHVGPFPKSSSGNMYILTIIDGFSKYFVVLPCKTLGARETIRHLHRTFGMFLGYPRRLISDRGSTFTSSSFFEFVNGRQIKHILNAVSTPRANGQVERFHRTFLNAIKPSIDNNKYWDEKIVDVVWGINNTVNASTNNTAFELLFGYKGHRLNNIEDMSTDRSDVREKREAARKALEKIANQMKERYDKRHRPPKKYKKGDLVLWRDGVSYSQTGINRKLDPQYTGPYVITQILGHDRYEIRSIKGLRGYKKFKTAVAADSLRRYHSIPGDSSSESDDELSE